MLKRPLLTGLAAITLATGLSLFAPVTANAGNLNIEIRKHNGHGSIYLGDRHYRPNYHKPRRHAVCHPGKAVYKAERRGVRHARIKRVGDRFVVVKGRKHGSKIKVAFYRDSGRCEIAWVKRHRNHNTRYGYVKNYRGGYRY